MDAKKISNDNENIEIREIAINKNTDPSVQCN